MIVIHLYNKMKKKTNSLEFNNEINIDNYNEFNTISTKSTINETSKNESKELIHTTTKQYNENKDSWICQKCTFLNTEYYSSCETCGTSRNSVISKSNLTSSDDYNKQSACIECGTILAPPNYLCKCDENKCIKCNNYYFDCICFDDQDNNNNNEDSDYEIKKSENNKSTKFHDIPLKEWTCKACQYNNKTFYDTCEICDLPKDSDDINKVLEDQKKTMEILKNWEEPTPTLVPVSSRRSRLRCSERALDIQNLKRQLSFKSINNMLNKIEKRISEFNDKEPLNDDLKDLLDISNSMSDIQTKIASILKKYNKFYYSH